MPMRYEPRVKQPPIQRVPVPERANTKLALVLMSVVAAAVLKIVLVQHQKENGWLTMPINLDS